MFVQFERARWQRESPAAQRWLRALLQTFADNKIVEDVHNVLRADAKANANTRMTRQHIQDLVVHSDVLESRSIAHATVPKADFVANFRRALPRSGTTKSQAWRSRPQRHRLPEAWSTIMGKRQWVSPTPEAARVPTAAWHWLHSGAATASDDEGRQANFRAAWLTLLVQPQCVLLRRVAGGGVAAAASLGSSRWGALVWPLQLLDSSPIPCWQFDVAQQPHFVHVTDLDEFEAVAVAAACPLRRSTGQGIVLRQEGSPVDLLSFALARKSRLSHADLLKLAKHVGVESARSSWLREDLLRAVALYISRSQDEPDRRRFADQIVKLDDEPTAFVDIRRLAEDPLLEAAFDELDHDDQQELGDLQKAFKQARLKGKLAVWRKARHAALAKAKPTTAKRKAKARGKFAARLAKRARREAQPGPAEAAPPAASSSGRASPPPGSGEPAPAPEESAPAEAAPPPASGEPAPEESAPPPAPLPAPPPPAADVAAMPSQRAAGERGPVAAPPARQPASLFWRDILCERCGRVAGQIKLADTPGNLGRGPVWMMRVPHEGSWPTSGPSFRTRRTSIVGESDDFAVDWVRTHSGCCRPS